MPTTIATISWPFVPGSLSTLVEYKVDGTTTWIQPTSPNNPTITNSYPLVINTNTLYDVRLTTNGVACAPKSMTLQIISVINNCCPPGYTLSTDQTYCYKTNTTAATPPSSQETTVSESNLNYSLDGTWIYNSGYNSDGTGISNQIPTSNSFWINNPDNLVNGPLNRSGLWATTTADNQQIGFSVCITVPTTSTYYVGLGSDNYAIVNLDGNNIITQNPTTLAAQYNSIYPGIGAFVTFRIWHVYPVTISAGSHVLELIGFNVSGPAALGAEVYNLTAAQLQAATSYASMGAGLIFSTKDYIGQNVQSGSGGIGYSCPSGYSLVFCTPSPYCTQTLTQPTIPCSTTTTTSTSTSTTSTTTTTTTTMAGEVSGSFNVDTSIGTICSHGPVTLYYLSPFNTGTTMYTDPALTHLLTGFNFIFQQPSGQIYNINSSTGVVGSGTGFTC